MWHVLIVLAATLACVDGVQAQVSVSPEQDKPVTKTAVSSPMIDAAIELKGAGLLNALREGGNILFMRHAEAGITGPECPSESMLTKVGESQARAVGAAIGRLRIPIAAVQSSVTCRTRQSATLLNLGGVSLNPDLNPIWMRRDVELYAQRFNYLLEPPPAGKNIVLVSHVHGSKLARESIFIDLAEIVVYRGVVDDRAMPVARVRVDQWADLLSADGQRR